MCCPALFYRVTVAAVRVFRTFGEEKSSQMKYSYWYGETNQSPEKLSAVVDPASSLHRFTVQNGG